MENQSLLRIWKECVSQEYPQLLESLEDEGDPRYLRFNQRIIPGLGFSYGVRFPRLRRMNDALAKNPHRDGIWECLAQGESFEEKILASMAVSRLTANSFDDVLSRVELLAERIDNWAVCDTLAGGLGGWVRSDVPRFFQVLPRFLEDSNPWARRLGLVLLLHLREEPWIEPVLSSTLLFQDESEYYVQMAVAWLVSMVYPVDSDGVRRWLESYEHSNIVNLTVRKIIESRQVSAEDKREIRQFKRALTP